MYRIFTLPGLYLAFHIEAHLLI